MPQQCIFCAIAGGEADARIVAETEDAIAFLDANPLAPGHTLVIPRDHYERLADLPGATGREVFSLLHRLVPAIEEAVDADATTVGFNDGSAAGQEVDHVHGHVIPRFEGDGGGPIHGVVGSRPHLDDGDLDDIAAHVAAAVGE
ncbi:MAG: HIT family protein [Halanaeroarchaeum sp.]